MAAAGSVLLAGNTKTVINCENIEVEIKKRILWTIQDWQNSGEDKTNFFKLINSMRYWYKKLNRVITEKSIVITLYNVNSEARLDIMEVIHTLSDLEPNIEVVGFSDFKNAKYLAIHFKNTQSKLLAEQLFKTVQNNIVVSLEWAAKPIIHFFRIHWLPLGHDLTNLRALLNNYIEIIDIKNESLTTMAGKSYELSLLVVRGLLRQGVTLEMLPHTTNIDSYECLITVFGRQPMCLTCNQLGHLSINCVTPYCKECKSLQLKVHDCVETSNIKPTYSQKVKSLNTHTKKIIQVENHITTISEQIAEKADTTYNLQETNDSITKISEYFEQLQQMKLPNTKQAKELLKLKPVEQTNIDKTNLTTDMETCNINLKRKSSEDTVTNPVEQLSRNNRRTYGRHKSKTEIVSEKSSNMFDVLLDRGEDTDTD